MSVKVLVLLSTYNGSEYIVEQLESILAQYFEGELNVLIRDDGSSDDTLDKIYGLREPRIEVIHGDNVGIKSSYMTLIKLARERPVDYYAFADQDDFWLPSKIQRAVFVLMKKKRPALYCSALNLVDETLNPICKYTFRDAINFKSSVFYNCATGCTCVFNSELLHYLSANCNVDNILMHDWWAYLVACEFGTVYYDCDSYILYRQHQANAVGLRTGFSSFIHRVKRNFSRGNTPSTITQAKEFLHVYEKIISDVSRDYLTQCIQTEKSLSKRLFFVLRSRPYRASLFENFISMIVFVLRR